MHLHPDAALHVGDLLEQSARHLDAYRGELGDDAADLPAAMMASDEELAATDARVAQLADACRAWSGAFLAVWARNAAREVA